MGRDRQGLVKKGETSTGERVSDGVKLDRGKERVAGVRDRV